MKLHLSLAALLFTTAAACGRGGSGTHADTVLIQVAPTAIASLDGSMDVTTTVFENDKAVRGARVSLSFEYTDVNGTSRSLATVTGETTSTGTFLHVVDGLAWAGAGTVTATVLDDYGQPIEVGGAPLSASASFTVVDTTPPVVTILPPDPSLAVGRLPTTVSVQIVDEVHPVEALTFDVATPAVLIAGSALLASTTTSATIAYSFDIPAATSGGTAIVVNASARDTSGNTSAAAPVELVVDPSILVSVPPGLTANIVTTGVVAPSAIVWSPQDGMLYVTETAGSGACAGSCLLKVNPSNGAATVVAVANGIFRGVAVDATGNEMYLSDAQNRLVRLTWNGTDYANPSACNDVSAQSPVDPRHLVFDPTLGILVADADTQTLERNSLCASTTVAAPLSMAISSPWGVAMDPYGTLLVSSYDQDAIFGVDRTTGAVTSFASASSTVPLSAPTGIEWLAGGTSPFADSLLVASSGNRRLLSTQDGSSSQGVASFVGRPTDVALDPAAGALYVVTLDAGAALVRIDGF